MSDFDFENYDPEKLLLRIAKLEESRKNTQLENERLKTRNARLVREQEQVLRDLKRVKDTMTPPKLRVPKWTVRKSTTRKNHVIPTLLLSDLHWDETVRPEQVLGLNAYNRTIAIKRLRRVTETAIKNKTTYVPNFVNDGIVVGLLGDLVTGTIHGMALTNDSSSMMDTCVSVASELCASLTALADEYGKVLTYSIPGNHDRNADVVPTKNQAELAWTWVIGKWIEHHFRDDPRVTVHVPKGEDYRYTIYETRYAAEHGHALHGGRDLVAAMTKMDRERRTRDERYGLAYDVKVCGHFHTYLDTPSFVVNGTLKGCDEYTKRNGYALEPPSQAFYWTTPERGKTMAVAIDARAKDEHKLWDKTGFLSNEKGTRK